MARIGEITVEGLGGTKKVLRKTLQPSINIFFGKNGGGKTTLLRTLHSALRNDASIIAESTVLSAVIDIESDLFEAALTRALSIATEQKASPQLSLKIEANSGELPQPDRRPKSIWQVKGEFPEPAVEFDSLYLSVSRLYSEALRQRNYLLSYPNLQTSQEDPAAREPSLEATFITNFNRKWSSYANRLLADIKRIQQNGLGSILQAVLLTNQDAQQAPEGDSDKAYELAKRFFERQPELSLLFRSKLQFKNHYSSNPSLRAVIKNIEAVEHNIDLAQAQRANLSKKLNQLFNGKQVVLTDSGVEIESEDGKRLTLAQLSTGEKQLLSLCVEILSIEGPGTILIDEPEMSLHVDWQKQLLETLHVLNPGVQIIVATHSPEIMADIDDRCIFRV